MKWEVCVFVARKKKLRMIETPEGRLPGRWNVAYGVVQYMCWMGRNDGYSLLKLKLSFKKRTLFESTILNCCASFIFFILFLFFF